MSQSKLFIIGNSGILHNAGEFLAQYWLRYKQAGTPLVSQCLLLLQS